MQSENLLNLETALRIFRILRLRSNLEITQPIQIFMLLKYTLAYHVPHAKHKESSLGHRYSVGCARCYDAWDSRLISYLLRFLTATFSLDHAQVLHVPTWELKGSPQVCTRPHRQFFMGPDFYKQHNIIFDKFYFHCRVVGQCCT